MKLNTTSLDRIFVGRFDVECDDETPEDVHIGSLILEEDESGFAHDLQIEVYSQNELKCLQEFLEDFDLAVGGPTEPFMPYVFRARDGSLLYTDAHGYPGEFYHLDASLMHLLARSSPRLGEEREALTSVVRAVHGLVGRARRNEPVFTVAAKQWGSSGYSIEFDHQESGLGEDATRAVHVGRFELSDYEEASGNGTRIDSMELDCWVRADGRPIGDQTCFGLAWVSRGDRRISMPVAVGSDGTIRGGDREWGWTNLFARNLLKKDGCFVLHSSGHLQRMQVWGDAHHLA